MIDFIPEPDSVYPIIMAVLKSCRHRGGCSLGSALRPHIAASLNQLGDYERVVTLSFVRCHATFGISHSCEVDTVTLALTATSEV